jgi:hypothetical protein
MKTCTKCKQEKSLSEFYNSKAGKDGKRADCKLCHNKLRDKWFKNNIEKNKKREKAYRSRDDVKARRNQQQLKWREENLDWELWHKAKKRSEKSGLPFEIERSDIIIPDTCPVLGIPLFITKGTIGDNSPTIDKVIPERGYVKDNIVVISARANRIKSDASLEEFELIYNWLKEQYEKQR